MALSWQKMKPNLLDFANLAKLTYLTGRPWINMLTSFFDMNFEWVWSLTLVLDDLLGQVH